MYDILCCRQLNMYTINVIRTFCTVLCAVRCVFCKESRSKATQQKAPGQKPPDNKPPV